MRTIRRTYSMAKMSFYFMVDQTDLIVDYEKITAMVGERYRSWEGWISLHKCVDRRSRSSAKVPHQRPPWQQKITFAGEKSLDSHIHVRVVYLLKTRRTRSSIKLRPTKVSLFYRDLQVSLRPCRQERSMEVVRAAIFASCMGRISICMTRVLRLKTERGIDHITLSLLCPCHEYSVTSLISYCIK